MVLEADRNGCVHEVLVIAAALSIQDPRERPAEQQEAADAAHRRFADPSSDFLTYLNLWDYLQEQQDELSSSAFRRLCRAEFLHYLRVREWQDLYGQLRQVVRSLGITVNTAPGDPRTVHRVAAGRPALAHRPAGGHRPARPGVRRRARRPVRALAGLGAVEEPPRWVMAAELVETSRLWGRTLARIEPEWAEALAGHLVKRSYSEPHWAKQRAAVVASERVTLYGLPIVVGRAVDYAGIDPELSRELFIRHALVEGDWDTQHRFFAENRELLSDVEELEHRARRRDILVDDETLFDFYDQRIPADVVSGRHFDAVVEEGPPGAARTCSPSPASCCSPVPTSTTARHPDRVAAGRAGAAADLPVRARRAGRRRHRPRPAVPAQPARPGRLRLAGARRCARSW